MSNKTISLVPTRDYPSIGTVGQSAQQLAQSVQAISATLSTYQRNMGNSALPASFIRVSDLVGLGFATLDGNQLTAASLGSSLTSYGTGTSLFYSSTQLYALSAGSGISLTPGTAGIVIAATGGGGTVTSVGLTSTGNDLTITGTSPITTSGTFDVELHTQSGLTAGSYTSANITVNSKGIVTAAANGSGGGSGVPVGTQVCIGSVPSGTNAGWSNYTLATYIPAYALLTPATKFKFSFAVSSGSMDIGHAYFYQTAIGSSVVTSVTQVTWSSNGSPTLAAGTTESDAVSITLDMNHDLYLMIYLPTSTNNSAVVLTDWNGSTLVPPSGFSSAYATSDKTSGINVGSTFPFTPGSFGLTHIGVFRFYTSS